MHAPMRQIAFSAVRVGAMVALAMLLILGLLPAILAVQAASHVANYMTSRRLGARDDPAALDRDGRSRRPAERVGEQLVRPTGPRRFGGGGVLPRPAPVGSNRLAA